MSIPVERASSITSATVKIGCSTAPSTTTRVEEEARWQDDGCLKILQISRSDKAINYTSINLRQRYLLFNLLLVGYLDLLEVKEHGYVELQYLLASYIPCALD